jgi:hypothetical protein
MQDIATDVKRSRLRAAVGTWELDVAFERALAADDERDRRKGMGKSTAMVPPNGPEEEAA